MKNQRTMMMRQVSDKGWQEAEVEEMERVERHQWNSSLRRR
jgi:hypothetical protein